MATNYRIAAVRAAQAEGVPPSLFLRLVGAESGFNPRARSPVGAIGLTQLMPGTARGLRVNPNDPLQNLRGGARYLAQQFRTFGSWDKALAAYNAGPGAVQKYGGIPPYRETQNYVRKILSGWTPQEAAQTEMADAHAGHDHGEAQAGPNPALGQIAALLAQDPGAFGSSQRKYLTNPIAAGQRVGRSPLGDFVARIAHIQPQAQLAPVQPAAAPEPMGAATPLGLARPGTASGFAQAPDYSWAEKLAKQFGLKVTSTLRNAAAQQRIYGGTGKKTQFTSRHLTRGGAADISGTPAQMRKLAEWAIRSGLFAEVFYDPVGQWDNGRFSRRGIGGHSDHVHLSFGTGALKQFYGG